MKNAITKNAIYIKIGLYVVLAVSTTVFARGFYSRYNHMMSDLPEVDEAEKVTPGTPTRAIISSNRGNSFSQVLLFGGIFFVSAVGLGLLLGHDISVLVAEKCGKIMYNDEGEVIKKSVYEEAEELWAGGHALDAIQKMRDYLKSNPREQHVAIRIAEIYEKDLNNPLAAALEYEEVLKQKLASEQWGWTAIHLCNIYNSKLGKPAKAEELLQRIVKEYGDTGAAEKARKRLGIEATEAGDTGEIEEPPAPAKPARPINENLQAQFKKFHQSQQDEPS
jgi:hypothetical protein